MYVDGRDPKSPIYIFSKHTKTYLRDDNGSPVLFVGEASEDAQGNLVDPDGNHLIRNEKRVTAQEIHVPSPQTAQTPENPAHTIRTTGVTPAIIPPTETHSPVNNYPVPRHNTPTHNPNYSTQPTFSAPPVNSPVVNTVHATPAPIYPPTQNQTIYADSYYSREPVYSREPAESTSGGGALVVLIAMLAIIIGGGGGFLLYNVTQNNDTSATENSSSSTNNIDHVFIPKNAHPDAGKVDIPANAKQLDTVSTPSGMHHCVLNNSDYLECQTTSWEGTQRYGSNNAVRLSQTGAPELTVSSVSSGVTLEYGEVAYNGNWICGSTTEGITCWSRSSSHGFVMNSNGYQPF